MGESNGFDNKDAGLKGQVISLIVLALMLVTIWYMLDLALLTFIITFMLYNIVGRLQKRFKGFSKYGLPSALVLALVYMLFILLLVLVSINFVPKVVQQFMDLSRQIMNFDFKTLEAVLDPRLVPFINDFDIASLLNTVGKMMSSAAAKIGQFSLNLFFALVLGFFLIVEKDKIKEFGGRLESSKISFIYKYFMDFGGVFANTFGSVMKVQVTISFINAVVSAVILTIMGFPSVFGLAVMMFFLGLIPVAGVAVSLIPLCTIAFTTGGIIRVVEVIIMILVIHALEAYVLNPRLMANRVRLPVCFVFIVLLVAEHYLGVWGLLFGVPVFIFLMSVLEVNYAIDKKKKDRGKKGTV
ncbi:MAG: AI-2E family transporter [Clostridiales bacterium]|nr:AI-2E family transporter [Clostridiales bacterium]